MGPGLAIEIDQSNSFKFLLNGEVEAAEALAPRAPAGLGMGASHVICHGQSYMDILGNYGVWSPWPSNYDHEWDSPTNGYINLT